jgi:hypothetical protein
MEIVRMFREHPVPSTKYTNQKKGNAMEDNYDALSEKMVHRITSAGRERVASHFLFIKLFCY